MAGGLNPLCQKICKKQADNDKSPRNNSFVTPYGFLDYGLASDVVPTAYLGTDNQQTNPGGKPAGQRQYTDRLVDGDPHHLQTCQQRLYLGPSTIPIK
jgi:hypothetical protein